MSNTPPEQDSPLRRLADSPAPWILAFGAAALIGLLAIAPKHHARQERLVRMSQTRDGIWYEKPDEAAPNEPAGAATDRLPSDDIELTVTEPPPKREAPPIALFVAISLAAMAAGLGLLSYLRSVSRERRPRPPRNDA